MAAFLPRSILYLLHAHHVKWMHNFFARQAPVRSALLNETPLAQELIELVLTYA
jgi:hypothetical protein